MAQVTSSDISVKQFIQNFVNATFYICTEYLAMFYNNNDDDNSEKVMI